MNEVNSISPTVIQSELTEEQKAAEAKRIAEANSSETVEAPKSDTNQ